MNRRLWIGLLGASFSNYAERTRRNNLLGVWKLQTCMRTYQDGHTDLPFGEYPVGRIHYDKAGRMSAMLMNSDRRSTLPPGIDLDHAPDQDLREAVTGFVAYFGTFDIDLDTQTIIHHVEASLEPAWVGADLTRHFHFDGANLILAREEVDLVDTLVWARELD